jgi:hypothetical protein
MASNTHLLVVSQFKEAKYSSGSVYELGYKDDKKEPKEEFGAGIEKAREFLNTSGNRKADKSIFFKETLVGSKAVVITEMNCLSCYVVGFDYYKKKAILPQLLH